MKHTTYNGADYVFVRPGEMVEVSSGRAVFTDTSAFQLVESKHREIVPGNVPFELRPTSFLDVLRQRREQYLKDVREKKVKARKTDKGPAGESRSPGRRRTTIESAAEKMEALMNAKLGGL